MREKFDDAREIIGQAIHDSLGLSSDIPEEKESIDLVNKLLDLSSGSYVLVEWPEVQNLMEEGWFEEEAILDVDAKFGSSAYFVPLKRLL